MKSAAIALLACVWICGSLGASDVPGILREGDALDAKNRNAEALEVYLRAEPLAPNDAEVLRRIAKQYAQMISDTPDRAEKIRLGKTALDYAQRAVAADPKNSDARLSLAICYGRVAFFESPKTRIEYSKKIESEARTAVELNPKNDYAWHVLGRWNYELASFNFALKALVEAIYGRFPDASMEQAAEYFERSIATGPPRVVHHVELGRTYLALGRKEDARAQLKKGLSLPVREKDDEETQERARRALAQLE